MLQNSTTGTVHNGQFIDNADGGSGWDLVAAAQRGDRDAYARLYQRYADGVCRVVLSRTGDRVLAEDLTGETFLRGLRRIDSVSDQGRDVGAWFTTIARNLVADHWKSSRYRLEQTTADFKDRAPGGDDRGPEQVVIDKETAAEVRRRVEQLPPDQRECLRLRFWEDSSVAETAAAMGRSENAVKALRHRAVGALRAALAEDAGRRPAAREAAEGKAPVQTGCFAEKLMPGAPMVGARRAVTDVSRRVAVAEQHRQTVEQDRAQQLARWYVDDRAAAERSAPGNGLGVA